MKLTEQHKKTLINLGLNQRGLQMDESGNVLDSEGNPVDEGKTDSEDSVGGELSSKAVDSNASAYANMNPNIQPANMQESAYPQVPPQTLPKSYVPLTLSPQSNQLNTLALPANILTNVAESQSPEVAVPGNDLQTSINSSLQDYSNQKNDQLLGLKNAKELTASQRQMRLDDIEEQRTSGKITDAKAAELQAKMQPVHEGIGKRLLRSLAEAAGNMRGSNLAESLGSLAGGFGAGAVANKTLQRRANEREAAKQFQYNQADTSERRQKSLDLERKTEHEATLKDRQEARQQRDLERKNNQHNDDVKEANRTLDKFNSNLPKGVDISGQFNKKAEEIEKKNGWAEFTLNRSDNQMKPVSYKRSSREDEAGNTIRQIELPDGSFVDELNRDGTPFIEKHAKNKTESNIPQAHLESFAANELNSRENEAKDLARLQQGPGIKGPQTRDDYINERITALAKQLNLNPRIDGKQLHDIASKEYDTKQQASIKLLAAQMAEAHRKGTWSPGQRFNETAQQPKQANAPAGKANAKQLGVANDVLKALGQTKLPGAK